ncbi:MAG: DinB family protein [Flavobacteriaceae bacterium]
MTAEIPIEEYAPFYQGYIQKSSHIELLEGLVVGLKNTTTLFETFPVPKQEYSYAEGKWTPKELFLHLIDSERVFAYRALFIARAKNAALMGFDQDEFVANCNAHYRRMESLIEEYKAVRNASISLFNSFTESDLLKMGSANNAKVSVRAIGKIIIGHEIHHSIILKERYL